MRLFWAPASPFARKTTVVIAETGLTSVELVPVSGNPVEPGSLPVDHNPLGKIPALITDSGETLYDSRVICRYLDSLAGAGLYPGGPGQWASLTLEATGDGIMEASVLMRYETILRPAELHHAPWVQAQWAKIERALDAIEARWMDHLSGPLDIGQISVACALGYLDYRLSGHPWRAKRPDLAAWEAEFSARPAMVQTQPAG